MDAVLIPILEVVIGPLAVTTDDGQALYDRIAPLIRSGQHVVLSFEGMEVTTPTFLNAAVGQLYGGFDHGQIHALLSVRDATPENLALLQRVVENAKRYFANRLARPRENKFVGASIDSEQKDSLE